MFVLGHRQPAQSIGAPMGAKKLLKLLPHLAGRHDWRAGLDHLKVAPVNENDQELAAKSYTRFSLTYLFKKTVYILPAAYSS